MAENSAGSPVFAGRYRFQSVGSDWDTGRSGFTHLVFDIQKERLGVMKRAELKSQQTVDNLKNEVAALLDLRGKGVPELYDTGETEYGAKKYFYMVIEYIDGIRIEKHLDTLTASERANILFQFFGVLTIAHRMGILNGDIDIKHLFWRRDKKQLVIIDWGNARLNIEPKNKSEFAFDLARAAEIIHTLVLRKGRAPVSGALTLPKEASILPGLAPVPLEFQTLCKWAPRTPSNSMQPPMSAFDLYEATKKWLKGVPYKTIKQPNWTARLIFLVILAGVAYFGFTQRSLLQSFFSPTATATSSPNATIPPVATSEIVPPSETIPLTVIVPSETPVLEPTFTPTATTTETAATIKATIPVTPTPRTYTTVLLDTSANDFPASKCWGNNLTTSEGLSKRPSDENMQFKIDNNRSTSYLVETDFNTCLTTNQITADQVTAIGLNVWIQNLELERTISKQLEDGRQFGIFLEDTDGNRREYTIWVDDDKKLQLRVRENNEAPFNEEARVGNLSSQGNLTIGGDPPNVFAKFPIQLFLEINNQGMDILYLQEGPESQQRVDVKNLSPNQMIIIDQATRPTLGTIVKIGLIGYGGYIQTTIWPLVFFGD